MCFTKMANPSQKIVYKLVLTGGPCGGKTTGQSRISTFFENLGWKVFRVPETATVLLSGGIKFGDLSPDEALKFQENLLKTMIQIENTFFELGRSCNRNCLIICDRGAMDASAFISKEKWEAMLNANNWNCVELRDNRYNHIVHMVSAANGAEDFYSTEDHACRSEGVELARELDYNAAAAWIGHPYFDVIDNSTDFDKKMNRMIACVCQKIGIDTGDRLKVNSKKRKFLIKTPLSPDSEFPAFQDFDVVHNYLQSDVRKAQARLRKRGQKGHWSYIHTIRKFHPTNGQSVEVRTQLTHRDYLNMLNQRDEAHFAIFKRRRCFIYNNQYYQLDIYRQPTHPRCRGMVLLETYSAAYDQNTLLESLPKFLTIEKEVTGDPAYSMYNLSLKEDWKTSKRYYTGNECNGHTKWSMNDHCDSKPKGLANKPNGHRVEKMSGHTQEKINGYAHEKVNGHAHEKMNGHALEKVNGHALEKVNGHALEKVNGHALEKVNGHAHEKMNGHALEKVNGHALEKVNGHAHEKMNGHALEKVNGHAHEKMNGHALEKVNGHALEKVNGHALEKVNGHALEKVNGHALEKVNGHIQEKANGHTHEKVNGHTHGKGSVHVQEKLNGYTHEKTNGCHAEQNALKHNGHHESSNRNVQTNGTPAMNGTHDPVIGNIQNTHKMDLGSPKIPKVALKI